MNILQIGTIDRSGGASAISWAIKEALDKRKIKNSMFVADKFTNDPNVFLIPRTVHRYISYIIADDTRLFNTDWIMETPEFKAADVIHCHNLHGFYFNLDTLKKMAERKPLIWTLHDMWTMTPHCAHAFGGKLKDGFYTCPSMDLYPRILWHNEKRLIKRKRDIYESADFDITVPSKWMKEKVEKSVLSDKKLHLIYNGIDTSIFQPMPKNEAREITHLPLNKKIVLFVGESPKHNKYKGWKYVEEIASRYQNRQDIVFVFIGGTEEDFSVKLDNTLVIQKTKDRKLLTAYYAAADIFLYPSLAESFGLVVAESMACGTPVVTFNTGALPELVGHLKEGYVADYENTEDLQKGLDFLLNLSPEEYKKMSLAAVTKVHEKFRLEQMVENYISLYNSMI
ncbi:MAG: glycosyltransferase [Candidatus Pacebacteria bacterium]|nr:glycosyltransferase [Candidatus Paceibacterota bacterium]